MADLLAPFQRDWMSRWRRDDVDVPAGPHMSPRPLSDLVNDPARPACGCDYCTTVAAAWSEHGEITHAIQRDRIHRRIGNLRAAFAATPDTP